MADLSKLKLPDNSEYNLKDEVARSGMVWYGTCNTLANTTEKAVTISGITSLSEGLNIRVKMLNEAAAASPTLNLNSLGAKAITRSAKPSLPSGYSRVLGFSMNDNSYFEIDNFKLTGADTVRFSFSMTANCNVFGCYTNSSATNNYSLFVSTSSTASYLRYNGGTYNSYIPAANRGQQLDVVITPHGVTGMPTNSSWTAKTFTASSDMCIGTSSPDASSASLIGNLYGAFIVDGRFNGIPCERLSDNALGYYDTYSKTFYEPAVGTPTSLGYDQNDYFDNAGTGEWAAGEVLDLVYDGTSWIIVDGAIADEETYGYTKLSDSVSSTSTNVAATANAVKTAYDLANGKQDALVSGTNIKTINNEPILGSGNITVSAEPEVFWAVFRQTSYEDISIALSANKICAIRYYEDVGFLTYHDDEKYLFTLYVGDWDAFDTIACYSGEWTNDGLDHWEINRVYYQPQITESGILKGDGSGGITAATAGTDYATPSSIPTASTTNPSMDGTASYGSGTSYARSNHVHPTDTSRAPTSHASTATTYGTGTDSNYGHVKLSDSTSSTSSTSGGTAATPAAVKSAYDLANGKQDALVSGTNIKTINNESVLGSGNLTISAEPEIFWATYGTTTNSEISAAEAAGKICAVNVTIQDGPMSFPVNCILVSHAYNTATFQCVYNSDIVEAVCAMDSWSVGTQAVSLTNHTHGNITSAGDITATAPTIASGDKLIINDESASKVTNGPAFGTSTTTFLRNDGAWAEPASGDSLPDQTGNTGKFLTTDGTDASWANLPSIPSPADANPLMDGTAAKGTSTDYAREDHVHPTDTSRAPTSHASSATTYGIGTDTNYGHVKLSASTSSTSGVSDGIAATPSAVKSAYDLANGKYSKPSTGIPATDLASTVQTSLGKADTALQSESDPVFTTSAAHGISSSDISNWNSKQAALESGTNIKTINNESLLGSGNITIQGGGSSLPSQTGHTGDILATDGTDPYWADTSEVTTLNIDTTVTASSSNLITSGAVSTALGAKANTSHDHGNITSAGDITASSPTIASGDKLIINDESASKITNGPAFGTSTTTFLRNDGTWAAPASGDSLPSQSGNSGKYLKTNGSTASWASVDALPSQSGHSGDYLTTNGSSASWADAVTTSTLSIDSAPTASSNNLVKSGGVYAAINTKVNRTSAVNEANTQYTTLMARGEKMIIKTSYDTVSDWSTELVNGAIAWCYE